MWSRYPGRCSLMGHHASKVVVLVLLLFHLRGESFEFAFLARPMITNNQAEYEAILKGLQLLHEVKAESIEVFGDSQLVINQLIGLYECKDDILRGYYDECQRLLKEFPHISLQHIPRAHNQEANRLAQSASGYRVFQAVKP